MTLCPQSGVNIIVCTDAGLLQCTQNANYHQICSMTGILEHRAQTAIFNNLNYIKIKEKITT